MISREDIKKLAALARISLPPEEEEELARDVTSIVGYISLISEALGEHVGPEAEKLRNVMREDIASHESSVYTEALLEAAPKREGNFIKVKKIL